MPFHCGDRGNSKQPPLTYTNTLTQNLRCAMGEAMFLLAFVEELLFLVLKDSFKRTDAYNPDGSTYRAASFIPLIPNHR